MSELPLGKVIAHVDLDAFYAQCEALRDPQRLQGRPVAVIQYNPYGDLRSLSPDQDRIMNDSNGSLIAVNYAAREFGVKRNHSGREARKLCPDLQLVQVPTSHGKADLTLYRQTGRQVMKILAASKLVAVERASIDECYLDVTAEAQKLLESHGGVPPVPFKPHQVHVYSSSGEEQKAEDWCSRAEHEWGPGERLLAAGAAVVAALRGKVEAKLGFTCSAGIGHSKLLAKLCSGLHKPAQQTVLPANAVAALLAPLPIGKIRGLGGDFGKQVVRELGTATVGQLAALSLQKLEAAYGNKDGTWLFKLVRGIDDAEVEDRTAPKSISCGKTFRGATSLRDFPSVHHWLKELAAEVAERVTEDQEDNHRMARLMTLGIGNKHGNGNGSGNVSRSCQLRRPEAEAMADDALGLVKKWAAEQPDRQWEITDLYLGVSNFVHVQGNTMTNYWKPRAVGEKEEVPAEAVAVAVEKKKKASKSPRGSNLNLGGDVDESFFAALPSDIKREMRADLKFKQIQARATVGKGAVTKAGKKGNKRNAGKTQTLKECFAGKRSKS